MFVFTLTIVGTGLLYILVAKFINENNAKIWLWAITLCQKQRKKNLT